MAEQNQGPEEVREPGTTGTYLVIIDPTATQQGLDVLEQQAGVSPDTIAETGEMNSQVGTNPDASVFLPDVGILIARGLSAEQVREVQALKEEDNPIRDIVPERDDYGPVHSLSDSGI